MDPEGSPEKSKGLSGERREWLSLLKSLRIFAHAFEEFKSEQTKKGHGRIVSAGDWDIHRSVHSPRR